MTAFAAAAAKVHAHYAHRSQMTLASAEQLVLAAIGRAPITFPSSWNHVLRLVEDAGVELPALLTMVDEAEKENA